MLTHYEIIAQAIDPDNIEAIALNLIEGEDHLYSKQLENFRTNPQSLGDARTIATVLKALSAYYKEQHELSEIALKAVNAR